MDRERGKKIVTETIRCEHGNSFGFAEALAEHQHTCMWMLYVYAKSRA